MVRRIVFIVLFVVVSSFLQAQKDNSDSSLNNNEYIICYNLHTISKSLFLKKCALKAELTLSEYDMGDGFTEEYYKETTLFEATITNRDTINLITNLVDTLLSDDIDDTCRSKIYKASIVVYKDKIIEQFFCDCWETKAKHRNTQLCAILEDLYDRYNELCCKGQK